MLYFLSLDNMKEVVIWSSAVKNKELLIGTRYEWVFDNPHDIDIAYYWDKEYREWWKEYFPFKELLDYLWDKEVTNDVLLTIKVSHVIYPIRIQKTLLHIQALLSLWAKVDYELLWILRDKWKNSTTHSRHHRGFNFPYDELFKDNVDRLIAHNELHKIISKIVTGNEPMWEKLKSQWKLSKLNEVTDEERFLVNLEEALVFVVERHHRNWLCWTSSLVSALEDLITRCSPEDEATYIALNYPRFRLYSKDKLERIYNFTNSIYGCK